MRDVLHELHAHHPVQPRHNLVAHAAVGQQLLQIAQDVHRVEIQYGIGYETHALQRSVGIALVFSDEIYGAHHHEEYGGFADALPRLAELETLTARKQPCQQTEQEVQHEHAHQAVHVARQRMQVCRKYCQRQKRQMS